MNSLITLFKDTFTKWSEHKAPRLGAALAYYALFSLTPLLMIAIAVSSFFVGPGAQGQIVSQLDTLLGHSVANAIGDVLTHAHQEPHSSVMATVVGVVTLLLGAAGLFGQLQDALNTVWDVAPRPGRGLWGMIKDRFMSFAMVAGVMFLLLVSLLLSAALEGMSQFMGAGGMLEIANFFLSFAVITGLFAMMFKILPDVEIRWADVWLGAAMTALLFVVGKTALGFYLGHSSTTSTYGAAGSLVLLLIWVYYASQILLFGAEFTQVYANLYGSHVQASEDAVPLTEDARAKQGIPPEKAVEQAAADPSQPTVAQTEKREKIR
jgi:membrane protein